MNLIVTGFELVTKRTRKRELLDEMNLVIPWIELLSRVLARACGAGEYPNTDPLSPKTWKLAANSTKV